MEMDWAKRNWDLIQDMNGLLKNYQSSQTSSLADVIRKLPALPEADVKQLLAVCLRCRRWYGLAVLAAVRYNQGLGSIPPRVNVKSHLTGRFCFGLLKYLETDLPRLTRLLSKWSGCVTEKALVWSAGQTLKDKDLEVFQTLVNNCSVSAIPAMKRVIPYVDSFGLAPQYEVLVNTPNQSVGQAAVECFGRRGELSFLVDETCQERVAPMVQDNPENKPDYSGCLAAACEAGLFSVSPPSRREERGVKSLYDSHIGVAVHYNQPDLVKFLYSTGTVSNRELFRACHDPELVRRCKARQDAQPPPSPDQYPSRDDGEAAREIRGFLLHKASRPRSLEGLCLREVSTRLGWGHVRKANVEQLDIPKHLKEALNFKHNKRLMKK